MAKFCGHCGAPYEGGAFCTTCGSALAPASGPPQSPAQPVDDRVDEATVVRPSGSPFGRPVAAPPPARDQPVQQVAPPPPVREVSQQPTERPSPPSEPPVQPPVQPPFQPAAPPAAPLPVGHAGPSAWPPAGQPPSGAHPTQVRPRTPAVNPFAGVPVGDYVRDVAAAVCLSSTLGKAWDLDGAGNDYWWVILSALVALASLAVPYLAKSGVVPGLGRDQSQLIKLAMNAPIGICVVAAVVNELVHATDPDQGGLGPGVALALAGALFAAQPRAADEDPGHRDDHLWTAATSVSAVVAVGAAVTTFVAFVLRDVSEDFSFLIEEPVILMTLLVSPLLTLLVLYGGAAREVLAHQFHGLVVFGTAALTATGVALLTGRDQDGLFKAYSGIGTGPPVERWDSVLGGVFLLSGAGVLALSRPALRRAHRDHPVTAWLRTARLALVLVATVGYLVPASYVLGMVAGDFYPAVFVAAAVLWAVAATIAVIVVSLLGGPRPNRLVLVSLTSAIPVLGIVLVAVLRSADRGGTITLEAHLDQISTAVLFSLPVLAVCALTVPAVVRRTYGPLLPDRGPLTPAQLPQQQWPASPPQQQWPASPPQQQWPASPPQQQWPASPPQQQWPTQPPTES